MKVIVNTDYLWDELNDKKRLALIMELVYTAPNAQQFCDKALKKLKKEKDKID